MHLRRTLQLRRYQKCLSYAGDRSVGVETLEMRPSAISLAEIDLTSRMMAGVTEKHLLGISTAAMAIGEAHG